MFASRNHFKTRFDLTKDKTGENPPFEGNEATKWGTDHEKEAIEKFEKDMGLTVIPSGLHIHPVHKDIGGSPDGFIEEDPNGMIEVKCPHAKRDKNPLTKHTTCPGQYKDQIQGLLEVLNKDYCWLIVWAKNDVAYVKVNRDRAYWKNQILPHLDTFRTDMREELRQKALQDAKK